jgi:hypothetical protein
MPVAGKVTIKLDANTPQFDQALARSRLNLERLGAAIRTSKVDASAATQTYNQATQAINTMSRATAVSASAFKNVSSACKVAAIDLQTLQAQSVQASTSIARVARAAQNAGHASVTAVQASSGAIRLARGGMENNMRAVERFMVTTLGFGPALQAIFPIVGAVAFAELFGSIIAKGYEWFKLAGEAPSRIKQGFEEMNLSVQKSNDELELSTAKLNNEIAKLEGKRQNTLEEALLKAKVAADELADSLSKDNRQLDEYLKKENIGTFKGIVTGDAPTEDLKDYFTKFSRDVDEINVRGRLDIENAGNSPEKQRAATIALNTELQNKYASAIIHTTTALHDAKAAQDNLDKKGPGWSEGLPSAVGSQGSRIEFLKGILNRLELNQRLVTDKDQNLGAQDKVDALRADKPSKTVEIDPLTKKLQELRDSAREAEAALSSVGAKPQVAETLKAHAAALKDLDEVNRSRQEHKQTPLSQTGPEEKQLEAAELTKASADAEKTWAENVAKSVAAARDRAASLDVMTAAIGRGYEATRRAAQETAVLKAVQDQGGRFDDPAWMKAHSGDLDRIRQATGVEFDAQHSDTTQKAIEGLNQQIGLERALASVQSQGAAAVAQLTLGYELLKMAREGATGDQIAAVANAAAAKEGNENAKRIAEINVEIDATKRLTAARLLGADAVRSVQAQLAAEKLDRDLGNTPGASGVETAAGALEQTKHAAEIADAAGKLANVDRDRLDQLDKEQAALEAMRATSGDTLGIEIALRDIENQRLDIEAKQLLQFGGMKDGVDAFFLEMEKSAKSSAAIIEETMMGAFNDITSDLAKLTTIDYRSRIHGRRNHPGAQVASMFGNTFKGIGEKMTDAELKSTLQKGLGTLAQTSIGQKLGLSSKLGLGAKRGDTPANPIYVSDVNGRGGLNVGGGPGVPASGPSAPNGPNSPADTGIFPGMDSPQLGISGLPGVITNFSSGEANAGAILGQVGKAAPSLIQAALAMLPMLATGGDVTADESYIVGEQGPEILTKTAGHVTSASRSRQLMGSGGGSAQYHYYNIDARGTDPVLTEQRVKKAITQAHQSAVATSFVVQNEHSRRVPVGSS